MHCHFEKLKALLLEFWCWPVIICGCSRQTSVAQIVNFNYSLDRNEVCYYRTIQALAGACSPPSHALEVREFFAPAACQLQQPTHPVALSDAISRERDIAWLVYTAVCCQQQLCGSQAGDTAKGPLRPPPPHTHTPLPSPSTPSCPPTSQATSHSAGCSC